MPQPLPRFGAPTMGGYSAHLIKTVQSAATTNETLVVARPTVLSQVVLANDSGTRSFIKFYDTAVAPVAGAGTPLFTLYLPGKGTVAFDLPFGLNFSAGLGYTIVKNPAITDATAAALDEVVGFFTYV
jgi:hypothetical protein